MNRIVIAVVGPGGASMQQLQGLGRQLMAHVRIGIDKMIADGKCTVGDLIVGENSMMVHLEVNAPTQGRQQLKTAPKPGTIPGKRGPKAKKQAEPADLP